MSFSPFVLCGCDLGNISKLLLSDETHHSYLTIADKCEQYHLFFFFYLTQWRHTITIASGQHPTQPHPLLMEQNPGGQHHSPRGGTKRQVLYAQRWFMQSCSFKWHYSFKSSELKDMVDTFEKLVYFIKWPQPSFETNLFWLISFISIYSFSSWGLLKMLPRMFQLIVSKETLAMPGWWERMFNKSLSVCPKEPRLHNIFVLV